MTMIDFVILAAFICLYSWPRMTMPIMHVYMSVKNPVDYCVYI